MNTIQIDLRTADHNFPHHRSIGHGEENRERCVTETSLEVVAPLSELLSELIEMLEANEKRSLTKVSLLHRFS